MQRIDNRMYDEKREYKITRSYTMHADGSVLIEAGNTKVICTAFLEDRVPPFLRGTGSGWITAEYDMLPSSTGTRKQRDRNKLKLNSRSAEIQRLIGRSLRSVVDMDIIGEKSIYIDCDVIQADGGTRTASITGAFIALYDCFNKMIENGEIECMPIRNFVAAISAGIVEDIPLLDLCYEEDSNAIADMNIVMNDKGEFIELGLTGEKRPIKAKEFTEILRIGTKGIKELIGLQREVLGIKSFKSIKKEEKEIINNEEKRQVIIASANEHKLSEIKSILTGYDVISMEEAGFYDDIEEDADTFEGNALLKARAIYEKTGSVVVGDDSGLMVDYLNGGPGVYSARYAGEEKNDKANNDKLLENLNGVSSEDRGAKFMCTAAICFDDGSEKVVTGQVDGIIGFEEKGDGGFGYDPLFYIEELDKTYAQLSFEEKNMVSHRKRAFEKVKEELDKKYNK